MTTSFQTIYDSFLTRVTNDMYLECTEQDTYQMLQDLLINAIPRFEFPRFDIFDYELGELKELSPAVVDSDGIITQPATYEWVGGCFNSELNLEEVNILSLSMVVCWLGQQLATTELTKIKYTGSDFKMGSQANHMAKLKNLLEAYKQECFHEQRLYKRRIRNKGQILSTMSSIMETPSYGYKI